MAARRASFHDASSVLVTRTEGTELPIPNARDDWDALLGAVVAKLHGCARGPPGDVKRIVLDCARSLEQLHLLLAEQRGEAPPFSLRALAIERLVPPLMPAQRDAAARKFTAACSPVKLASWR